ncbi:hypothetical protein BWI17_12980 [Betaproteobacteria bacterium GR16-43]|nr:hypothetical protein BWI17_12980 [Betaproteobacteria bacterium GR16-43]
MKRPVLVRVLATLAAAACASSALAADIVLTPPERGGVTITNSFGDLIRLRVSDDGSVAIPGVGAVPLPATGLCVEIATGKVGTCLLPPAPVTNLILENPSTAGAGNILKGSNRFIHNFGSGNTFIGELAGNFTMTGLNNTGSGLTALNANTTGEANTAAGSTALGNNTTGDNNTAIGTAALFSNTTGNDNTATGVGALAFNTTGYFNTAGGRGALFSNSTGDNATAVGYLALTSNTTGAGNTAVGARSLKNTTTGVGNVAVGRDTLLSNQTGVRNIAIGEFAGVAISSGNYNIHLGHHGVPSDTNMIRIGDPSDQSRTFIAGIRGTTTGAANAIPVVIDSNGQLGTVSSSERFKDDIADMAAASDALMKLRPVTFHYRADQDPAGRTLQYGLIAEEVAQVYPGLVAHSADGQVETVMVQFLPAMLLNEVQKQRRTIDRLESELSGMQELRSELAALKQHLGLR